MGYIIHLNKVNNKGINGGDNMIDVLDVAKAFLSMGCMSHKKLQKLCYYAQAWYITLNGKPLFPDTVEAWAHGPVIPNLYKQYNKYGSKNIPKEDSIPLNIRRKVGVSEFLKKIYRIYGQLSADDLELLTHTEDPWVNARLGKKEWEPGYDSISLDDMKYYYEKMKC